MRFVRSISLLIALSMLLTPVGGSSDVGEVGEKPIEDRAGPFSEWSVDFSVRNTLDQARGPEFAWAEFGVPEGVLVDRDDITLVDRNSGRELRVGLLEGDMTEHEDGSVHRAKVHFKDTWDAGETKDYKVIFGRTPTATGSVISSSVQGDFVVVNDGPRQYQVHTADTLFKSPQSVYYLYILNGEFRAYGTVLTRVGGNQLDPDQASFQMWWGDRTYIRLERTELVNRVTLRYDDPEIYHWGPGGSAIADVIRHPELISAEVQLTFYQGIPRVDVHSKKTIHERFWNHNGFVMEFSAIRGDGADWQGEFETVYGTDARIVMTTTTQGPTWTRQSTQWQGIDVASDAAPAFSDLDGDGDLDLVLGSEGQGLKVFRNEGDRTAANMVENATWAAGLPNLTSATPTLGDLDDDGDADLLVGDADGRLRLYRNDGGAGGPPAWNLWTGNFDRLDLGAHTTPALGDADGDGDLDIMVGLADGTLKGIENTGSTSAHTWSMDDRWVDHLSRGLTKAPCDAYSAPSMVDVDYDGDTDLLLGSDDGKVIVFENMANRAGDPSWTRLDVSHHAGVVTGSHWESNSTPVMVDIDGDGDRDLLVGNHLGRVYHWSFDGNTTPAKGHNNLQPLQNGTYRYMRDKDGNDGPFTVEGYGSEWYDYYVLANPRTGYAAMRFMPDFERLAYKQEYWGDEFEFAGGNVSYYPYEPQAKEYVTRALITSNPMSDGVSAGTFISQTGTSAGFVMQPMTAMTYESRETLLLDLQRRSDPVDYDAYMAPLAEPLEVIIETDLYVEVEFKGFRYGNLMPGVPQFTFKVHNTGDDALEGVDLSYEAIAMRGDEEVLVGGGSEIDINPGGTTVRTELNDWNWSGPVLIRAAIDSSDKVDESDEYNNNATYIYEVPDAKLRWERVYTIIGWPGEPCLHADAIVRRDGKLLVVFEKLGGEEEIDLWEGTFDPSTGELFTDQLVIDSHYAVEPDLAMMGDVVYLAYSSNIEALRNYHRTAHAKYYWGEKFDLYSMTWDDGSWSDPERITRAVDFDDSHQTPELVMQEGSMTVYFRSTHFQFYTNGNQMDNIPFQDMDLRAAWELGGGGWSSGNRTVGETTGSQAWWGGPSATPHGTNEVWTVYASEVGNAQWDLYAEWNRDGSPSPGRQRLTSTGGADEIRPVVVSGGSPPVMVMAYETDTNGNRDIAVRVKRGGQAWGTERLLTTDTSHDMKPAIAYDGHGSYWVAWESERDGNKDIFISTFDGDEWRGPIQVTSSSLAEEEPVLACDDQTGRVFLVYEEGGTEGGGMLDKRVRIMHMLPTAPALTLDDPLVAYEDSPAIVTGNASDPDLDIRWFEWDWGDGNTSITPTANGTHLYSRSGEYAVSAVAVDWTGLRSPVQRVTVNVENVAPYAVVTGPVMVDEDTEATFTCAGSFDTPSDNATLTVTWEFEDGTSMGPLPISEGLNVTHVFTTSGGHTVTVTVTDDDDASQSASHMVTVSNNPPWCEARTLFEDLEEDELGEFSGEGHDTQSDEEEGLSYQWDWGDGTTSEVQLGPQAVHAYQRAGTYNATLFVFDDDGAEGTASVQVVVVNLPPEVTLTGKSSVDEDDGITLTAVGDDTPYDKELLEYQWDWGDGTVSEWGDDVEVSHTYTDEGNYRVKVTVRDDDGETHTVEHLVVVENVAPIAKANAFETIAREGLRVRFNAYGTTDTPSDLDNLTYRWDTGTDFLEGFEVHHVFKTPGMHTITLTVTDDDGEISRAYVDVLVTNNPPSAQGWVTPVEVRVGEPVFLDASNTTDDPWDIGGLRYKWRMGDGTEHHTSEASHVYLMPGTYSVFLEVTDGDGDKMTAGPMTVTVLPAKTEKPDDDGGLSVAVVGGGIALAVIVLLLLLFLFLRARREPVIDEEEEETTLVDEGAEEEGFGEPKAEEGPPPEPDEVLVEEEVEVIEPKTEGTDPEELLQRIKDLDVEDED